MTSSKMRSAPPASQARAGPRGTPAPAATRFMLAATGSTMTQATRSSRAGHHVVGDDLGVGHRAGGDAGRAGQAEHGDTAPAAGQQAVGVAVVAAVELDHAVAAGRATGEAHRAHGRFGPGRDQAHLLAAGHPRADRLGQQDLAGRRRAERRAARRGRRRRPRSPRGARGRAARRRRTGPCRCSGCPRRRSRRRPRPRRRCTACPPTEANERTGESTPPGMTPPGPGEPLRVRRRSRRQPPSASATSAAK